jgi:type VI secretion system protein VasI
VFEITIIRYMKLLVCALFFCLPFSAGAQVPSSEVAVCAATPGDLDRLQCFDDLARAHNLEGPQPQPVNTEGNGKWAVSSNTNPIDDSTTVVLVLQAESGRGSYGDPVALIIRCSSNQTNMYINWRSYMTDDTRVTTRIGDASAQTAVWSNSTDNQATFRRQPIPFVEEMMTANSFVAQATPYSENAITAIFDTSGLKNAIRPLREECGW